MTAAKPQEPARPATAAADAPGSAPGRNRRVVLEGTVKSDKMAKTRVVQSVRLVRHPKYGKFLRRYTRYYVDDPKNESHVGDRVEIVETRPLSRLKRWRLLRVIERSVSGEGFTAAEPSAVISDVGGSSSASSNA